MATKPITSVQDLILDNQNLQTALNILIKGLKGMNTPKAKELLTEYRKYVKVDNSTTYVIDKSGRKISRRFVIPLDGPLYNASPDCVHEQDSRSFNGVKCIHCHGWYCA